jgi:guanylate kinase
MIGKIFVISAPCGAGKSSLVSSVIEELQKEWPIESVITYTTRKPRNNERHGQDYYFIDIPAFEQCIQEGFFLEWSNAYTAYYGSPRSILNEINNGKSFTIILDRAGARILKSLVPEAVLIWIEVPFELLQERLLRRATENSEQLERRLERSRIEIEQEKQDPLYHHIVVNKKFQVAKYQLKEIIERELQRERKNLPKNSKLKKLQIEASNAKIDKL